MLLDVTNDGSPGDVKVAHIQGPVDSILIWADMASLGDIDGDGLNDVMVGAPGSSKAYLYMGVTTRGNFVIR